jgi:hypothetical protein
LPLDELDPTVGDGLSAIRYLQRSSTDNRFDGQSWKEPGHRLSTARWYASAQVLADGSIFMCSGSKNGLVPTNLSNNNPTFELLDHEGYPHGASRTMAILEKNQPYYMYPFLHLLPDGSLFVFVSKSAELFNIENAATERYLPDLQGDYRTYPNTGGSVLLPLTSANGWYPEIVICGGGAEQDIDSITDASCGRIQPLSNNPEWEIDSMPEGRGMVEGTLLPDGTVIWLNGAKTGAQGFVLAKDPAYEALIYDPNVPLGKRWTRGASSEIARLYHSISLLMLDGTILVAGSNPNEQPILEVPADSDKDFITEFRVEVYTPPYLQGDKAHHRPTDIWLSSKHLSADGEYFEITYASSDIAHDQDIKVALYHGGFSTHALHMGQRMIFLDFEVIGNVVLEDGGVRNMLRVGMPGNRNVSPPGPYVVYIVVNGVPGLGQFVMVG